MLAITNIQPQDFGTYRLIASNALGVAFSPAIDLSAQLIVGPAWCPNLTDAVAVASSVVGQGCVLRRDGTVQPWGQNDYQQSTVPPGLSNVVAVSSFEPASGSYFPHSLALTASGTVYSWGKNTFTNASPILSNIVAICAGDAGDAFLAADGTATRQSTVYPNQRTVGAGTNVVAVAVEKNGLGAGYTVRADGLVTAIGGSPIGLSNVVAVSLGRTRSLALLGDGTVTVWGGFGQSNGPPGLSNVIDIAGSDRWNDYCLALKDDGTLVAWGTLPGYVSNMVATVTNAVQIDSGAALIGTGAPFITTPLPNRFGPTGGQAFFRALATGERPLAYQWTLNGLPLLGQTRSILSLTNLTPADAGTYVLIVTNAHGSATSAPAVLTVFDYAPALESPDISWTSFGDGVWIPEATVSHDGVSAVMAPSLPSPGGEARATLRGTITGPGTLKFWWKSSGSSFGQLLGFYLNNSPGYLFSIFGNADWQQKTVYLGAGVQTLDWVYRRFGPTPQGQVWVDNVTFTPGAVAPFITGQPASQAQAPGADVHLAVSAAGTPPLAYQWKVDGSDIPGATDANFTLTNFQPSEAGTYTVAITNMAGEIVSSNATLVPGRIAIWGPNYLPVSITNATAVAAGLYHGLALQPDGSVLAWGNNNAAQSIVPLTVTNASAVGAGAWFSMAVNALDGTLTAWGDNAYGQVTVPVGLSNILMAAGGFYHAAALRSDGSVMCWGSNGYGQTNVPNDLTNAVQIAVAGEHNVALRANGTAVAWGRNSYGETNVPTGLTDVVSVRAGFNHSMALKSDGTVVVWGITNSSHNLNDVPPGVSNVLGIAAGGEYNLALMPDGRVTWWGLDRWGDAQVPAGLTNVASLTAGGYFSLAMIADGLPRSEVGVREPRLIDGRFQVAVQTSAGHVYRLEYKDSLADAQWNAMPLIAGTGREQTMTDSSRPASQRFYRVRAW